MCGIAGIVSNNSHNISVPIMEQMLHAIQHRGPDGEGVWKEDQIILGHKRLSILDLSASGNQPMHFANKYSIVYNGEIYNYKELKTDLEKNGYSFQSSSDTEVLLASYDFWKEECVLHFDGMFAFAIWNNVEKKVFAARDRFGEKPFYYFFNNEKFVFASEMKALWAAGINKQVNQKMLFNFLTIGYTDNPNIPEETFYNNIQKLPAANTLTYCIHKNEIVTKNYWDIDVENIDENISDTTAIETFQHLLETSVKRRLRSHVEVGTSLSGGLDSSSIVSLIHSILGQQQSFKTFSAVFPNFEKNEEQFIDEVSKKFNTTSFKVNPSEQNIVELVQKIFYHQEEPFDNASLIAQYAVFEIAQQQGVKVLLDGQGADETLAGYHKYYKWFWQGLFRKRKLLTGTELSDAKKLGVQEKFGLKNVAAAIVPELANIFLEKQSVVKALKQKDLTKEFVQHQSGEAYYQTPTILGLNGILYFNTRIHGLEELLRFADRNSMAHGLEVRLPFLNYELVEFLFKLPATFKIRNGYTKWLLRNAMKEQLPNNIVWRADKTGFEPPQKSWMQQKPLQEMIHAMKESMVKEKILHPAVLQKNIEPSDAYTKNNINWKYLTAGMMFE